MSELIDPMREQGIRLWVQASDAANDPQAAMLVDLLQALDRARIEIQGLRTEISVHERRTGLSKSTAFTAAEEGMLKFALDTAQQVVFNRSSEFSDDDTRALAFLRDWVNGR